MWLQLVRYVSPPEVFQKHRKGERDEQSNRDKRKQLNFFTSVHLKYLQLMSLFRANTGVNDRKFFKVNLFRAIEMKLSLFVVWGFSFLMLINVCYKIPSDFFRNILTLPLKSGWRRCYM